MATLALGGLVQSPQRLLEPVGYKPPAEAEAAYYRQLTESAMVA